MPVPSRHSRKPRRRTARGGREYTNPFDLEKPITEYLSRAREQGPGQVPLDLKTIARAIGCSHNHFSPKQIDRAPPAYRQKWRELRAMIAAARMEARRRRRTALEHLQAEVAALRQRLQRAEREKEQLWIWMIEMEAGLEGSGINTEMFVPEDLRYYRDERRRKNRRLADVPRMEINRHGRLSGDTGSDLRTDPA